MNRKPMKDGAPVEKALCERCQCLGIGIEELYRNRCPLDTTMCSVYYCVFSLLMCVLCITVCSVNYSVFSVLTCVLCTNVCSVYQCV